MLIEATVKCYTITLGDLCRILEDLGRGDVITEMEPYFGMFIKKGLFCVKKSCISIVLN